MADVAKKDKDPAAKEVRKIITREVERSKKKRGW